VEQCGAGQAENGADEEEKKDQLWKKNKILVADIL